MEQDRDDLIFLMANQTTFPSWGDLLRQGATTSFESWTGGSHIHDTLISIGAWFIQGLGGIQVDETAPGFKHVIIRPGIVGDLTFARAKMQSMRGEIRSNWRIENGSLKLDVTVPPGATATILMPGRNARAVTKTGIRSAAPKGNRTPFEVGSGKYSFTSRWPAK